MLPHASRTATDPQDRTAPCTTAWHSRAARQHKRSLPKQAAQLQMRLGVCMRPHDVQFGFHQGVDRHPAPLQHPTFITKRRLQDRANWEWAGTSSPTCPAHAHTNKPNMCTAMALSATWFPHLKQHRAQAHELRPMRPMPARVRRQRRSKPCHDTTQL